MSARARRISLVFALILISLPVAAVLRGSPTIQAPHMQEHFKNVLLIQQAIVRGDLEDARAPARWMADHQTAEGLPEMTERLVVEMRKHAQQVAGAKDLDAAADAAASLVVACGTCHAAVGRRAAVSPPQPAKVEAGTVGHMMEHQRAVNLMEHGLLIPSDQEWKTGAAQLGGSPLAKNQLPRDPALTNEVMALEARLHQLGTEAAATKDAAGRAKIWGRIIASCGHCHGLHGRVWGPGVPQ